MIELTIEAIRWVWRASPRLTLVNAGLVAGEGVLPIVSLYALKLLVNAAERATHTGHHSVAGVIGPLALLAGASAADAALSAATRFAVTVHGQALTDYMVSQIHEQSIAVDLAYYENPSYQDTVHRAQQEAALRPAAMMSSLVGLGPRLQALVPSGRARRVAAGWRHLREQALPKCFQIG